MNKSQLKKAIRQAKFDYHYAEIHHGHDSEQRKAEIKVFWDLQAQLGAIELAEIDAKRKATCAS